MYISLIAIWLISVALYFYIGFRIIRYRLDSYYANSCPGFYDFLSY